MTGHLPYDANLVRLEDLRREAGTQRRLERRDSSAATPAPAWPGRYDGAAVAIRRATHADRAVVERLAALDGARAPAGEVLIAEVDGEPQAAIEIASGATVADPFRPTAHVVELLGLRAAGLRRPADSRRRVRLPWRTAFRTAY